MNIFDEYRWHSSLEMNEDIKGKKILKRVANTPKNRSNFIRVAKDSDFLIHKSVKALWRFSEDGKHIQAVFDDDILTQSNF